MYLAEPDEKKRWKLIFAPVIAIRVTKPAQSIQLSRLIVILQAEIERKRMLKLEAAQSLIFFSQFPSSEGKKSNKRVAICYSEQLSRYA